MWETIWRRRHRFALQLHSHPFRTIPESLHSPQRDAEKARLLEDPSQLQTRSHRSWQVEDAVHRRGSWHLLSCRVVRDDDMQCAVREQFPAAKPFL